MLSKFLNFLPNLKSGALATRLLIYKKCVFRRVAVPMPKAFDICDDIRCSVHQLKEKVYISDYCTSVKREK